MIKIDRDLRLADVMARDPAWFRRIAGAETPGRARNTAITSLEKLLHEGSLGPAGLEAYAILKNGPSMMAADSLSDYEGASAALANHHGTWWQAKLVETIEATRQPAARWRTSYDGENSRLRTRSIVIRSSVWLLGFLGIICLPHTIAALRDPIRIPQNRYLARWSVPQGLVIFLAATLAWIGLVGVVEAAIANLPAFHPLLGIVIDSSVRLLPAGICLAFLFRRPIHAIRAFGLAKWPDMRPILGALPILMALDVGLQVIFGTFRSPEPGGGLNLGDAGLWGLAFSIVSACLVAPIAEEIVYRGVLFTSFRNSMGLLPAAAASATAFALLHFYDGYGMASVAVFGFVCALLYASTGSLATCILLHMLYNSLIKLPEWIIYHAPLT